MRKLGMRRLLPGTIVASMFLVGSGLVTGSGLEAETPLHPLDSGNRYYIAGNFEKAITNYALAVAADPESNYADTAIFQIGRCYAALDNWRDAESVFLKITQSFPDSPWADDAILDVARHHRRYASKQSQEKAIGLLTRLLRDYATRDLATTAMLELAESYLTLGTFPEAELWLNRVIQESTDVHLVPRASFLLGQLYANPNYPNRQLNKALEQFKKVITEYKSFPELPAVYFSMGACYQTMKEWRPAISNYRTVVELYPGSMFAALAQANLADCYREMRDYAKAAEELKTLVANYPIRPSHTNNESTQKFINTLMAAAKDRKKEPELIIEADNTSSKVDYVGNVKIEFRDLTISANQAVSDNEQHVVMLNGKVRLQEGARVTIEAEHAVLDVKRYEVTARGAVRLSQDLDGKRTDLTAIMVKYNFGSHRLSILEQ